MNKASVYTYKGMRQDDSKFKHSPEFYYEAMNFRLNTLDGQSLGSIQNEYGNYPILTIPSISVTQFTNKLRFTYSDSTSGLSGSIDTLISERGDLTSLLNTTFNTTCEVIGVCTIKDGIIIYASGTPYDTIWRAYINDNNSGVAVVTQLELIYVGELNTGSNIEMYANYENEALYKVYWVDGINQFRSINFNRIIQNGNVIYDPNSVNPNSLNMMIPFNPSNISVERVNGTSNYNCGMIQYAYNLYKVNYAQSVVSPLTQPIPLDKGTRGGEANEKASQLVKLNFTLDSDDIKYYDYVRIYSVLYTTKDALPSIKIVSEQPLNTNNIEFIDSGNTNISNVSLDEFIFLGGILLVPKTFAQRNNRLFFANYTRKNLNISNDVRCLGFNSNKDGQVKYKNGTLVNYTNTILNLTGSFIPVDCDTITTDYDLYNRTTFNNYGVEGRDIRIDLQTSTAINLPAHQSATTQAIESFRRGEVYRLGIQAQNEFGVWSATKWCCDYKIPDNNVYPCINESGQAIKIGLRLVIKNRIQYTDGSYAKNVRLVAVPITLKDRSIITSGIINSTLFYGKDRDNNGTYGMPDYFFRMYGTSSYGYGPNAFDRTKIVREGLQFKRWEASPFRKISGSRNYILPAVNDDGVLTKETTYKTLFTFKDRFGVHTTVCSEIHNYTDDNSPTRAPWYQEYKPDENFHNNKHIYMDCNLLNLYSLEVMKNELPDVESSKINLIGWTKINNSYTENRQVTPTGTVETFNRTMSPGDSLVYYKGQQDTYYGRPDTPDIGEKGSSAFFIGVPEVTEPGSYEPSTVQYNQSYIDYCSGCYFKTKKNPSLEFIKYINDSVESYNVNINGTRSTYKNQFKHTSDDIEFTQFNKTSRIYKYNFKSSPHLAFALSNRYTLYNSSTNNYGVFEVLDNPGGPYGTKENDARTYYGQPFYLNGNYDVYSSTYPGYLNDWTEFDPINGNANFDTPKFILGELTRDLDPNSAAYFRNYQYGGQDLLTKSRNIYIPISNSVINSVDSEVITYNGFAYIGSIGLLKSYTDLNLRNVMSSAAFYYGESWINPYERTDNHRNLPYLPGYTPDTYHKFNDVYQQQNTTIIAPAQDERVTDGFYSLVNTVIASKPKTPGEFIDSWTDVLENEYLSIEGNYGPINKLQEINGQILAFQDKAVAYLLIQPRVQVPTSDGLNIETGTGQLFETYRYLTTTSGSINKQAVVKAFSGLFYLDLLNKGIFYLSSFEGAPINLSEQLGMNSVFYNLPDTLKNIDIVNTNPNGVVGFYNPVTKDIYFTILNGLQSFTIAFNEITKTFTSFYNYTPSIYSMGVNTMFTLSRQTSTPYNSIMSRTLFSHSLDYASNVFYGNYYPSYITYLLNPEPFAEKTFVNTEFESELFLKSGNVLTDVALRTTDNQVATFTSMQLFNDYQDSGNVPLVDSYFNYNIKRKFRTWRMSLPRNTFTDRVNDHYSKLKLTFNHPEIITGNTYRNYRFTMHDMILFYNT